MNTAYTFQVPSLSCGHCVAAVTQALAKLGVSREQIEEALRAAGYPPAPAA